MMLLFTVLSPEEVRRKYERAENKAAAIRMLCELTACKRSEMVEFLGLKKTPVSKYDPRSKAGRPLAVFDEELARKLLAEGKHDLEIADAVGVSKSTIFAWRKRNDLQASYKKKYADRSKQRMELYRAGATDREIAVTEGVRTCYIVNWREKRELPPNETKKGNRHGN